MSYNLTAELNRLILEEDERQTEEGLKYLGRSNKKIIRRSVPVVSEDSEKLLTELDFH
jgi:hypothetical protein